VAQKAAARGAVGLTALQGQHVAFIRAYGVIHGVAPAEADMPRFFRRPALRSSNGGNTRAPGASLL